MKTSARNLTAETLTHTVIIFPSTTELQSIKHLTYKMLALLGCCSCVFCGFVAIGFVVVVVVVKMVWLLALCVAVDVFAGVVVGIVMGVDVAVVVAGGCLLELLVALLVLMLLVMWLVLVIATNLGKRDWNEQQEINNNSGESKQAQWRTRLERATRKKQEQRREQASIMANGTTRRTWPYVSSTHWT